MGIDKSDGGNSKVIKKVRRRLYYVPGMISLLALPIVCYFYLKPFIRDERSLEIIVMANYKPEKVPIYNQFGIPVSPLRYDSTVLSLPGIRRRYSKILLNGNEDADQMKLDTFRIQIRKMKKENDSINGVHLIFGDSTTYGVFIQAINICNQEEIMRYAIYRNNLWVSHVKQSKEYLERQKKRKEERKKRNKEEMLSKIVVSEYSFKDRMTSAIKIWPIFAILFVLSFLSIRKVVRSRRS